MELCARHLGRGGLACLGAVLLASVVVLGGCGRSNNPAQPVSRHPRLPAKEVPAYLKGTILERTDLAGTEPFVVSGYGLVVNLRGTGDTTAPSAVRQHIVREMVKRGFGQRRVFGYENLQPEEVLRDPRVAIVQVDGLIPPGARQGQRVDVRVAALPQSQTSSLAGGELYRVDLTAAPGTLHPQARCEGPIFVNPAYAVQRDELGRSAQASLRQGTVMDGGLVTVDRPLMLRLRQPQRSTARAIERRIEERFQGFSGVRSVVPERPSRMALARDEGIVEIYVPREFEGDWERFAGIVNHLYLNDSPEFVAAKARELAAEAVKPDAPLLNISYAWEGLGPKALPFVVPLMEHSSPEVAFAAARAAVFLRGGEAAQNVLMQMARTPDHPFQVNAVQVLGAMPNSPAINTMLRRLLDSDQALVQVEAYKVLARHRDSVVISRVITGSRREEKFILDVVNSAGPPLIYAARSGLPRIALLGGRPSIDLPVLFTAMGNRLSISSGDEAQAVSIFYRGEELRQPIQVLSRPDLAEVIARLGGEGAPRDPRLNFSYSEIVGIIQAMNDADTIRIERDGRRSPVAFMLQEMPAVEESIFAAPPIPEGGRPQAHEQAAPIGGSAGIDLQ